ncbi:unnamed protein product [Didymodactylos carnosus]|uniref:Short-chain dehydrogenase n=1 Tax=Didymodactylos carnosus TaxID=1234261 RepID=A0A815CRS9_9BILA|nr:unnamed protein product [Didymodactylos carnosus]CAF4091525.1 unnamed protein product [Didymodactylos carnosus]
MDNCSAAPVSLAFYSKPLNLKSSTVLITGGGAGIGHCLAERFLKSGSIVIITGRCEDRLKKVKQKLSINNNGKIYYHAGDLASTEYRHRLCEWVVKEFPSINVLVNNAATQRKETILNEGTAEWYERENEIHVNLSAPIHLSSLLIPYFLKQQKQCAVINVTTGLAFIPTPYCAVYAATKAALHSFTMSLRFEFESTNIPWSRRKTKNKDPEQLCNPLWD